jgi:hypothetical protein
MNGRILMSRQTDSSQDEFKNFQILEKDLLSVPKKELDKKEAEYQ